MPAPEDSTDISPPDETAVRPAEPRADPTQLATFVLSTRVPLTLEWSAWYAGRSLLVLGILMIVMGSSAYFSLGGGPLLGKAVLDD